jgi:hypothetical protein
MRATRLFCGGGERCDVESAAAGSLCICFSAGVPLYMYVLGIWDMAKTALQSFDAADNTQAAHRERKEGELSLRHTRPLLRNDSLFAFLLT